MNAPFTAAWKGFRPVALLVTVVAATGFGSNAACADEWIELLSGDSLDGWVVEGTRTIGNGPEAKPVWTAEDGVIACAGKGFGFLRYDRPFADFDLRLEYRMSPGCNSGIGIRGVKFTGPASTRPSFASYEIQILDDGEKQPSKHSSMSLYRYVAPQASAARPAGEWNDLQIVCRGPRIEIVLNGEKVQQVDQSTIPEIAEKPLSGYISLQNHGKPIEFRAIRVMELDETP